jgi:hypothetical protein
MAAEEAENVRHGQMLLFHRYRSRMPAPIRVKRARAGDPFTQSDEAATSANGGHNKPVALDRAWAGFGLGRI